MKRRIFLCLVSMIAGVLLMYYTKSLFSLIPGGLLVFFAFTPRLKPHRLSLLFFGGLYFWCSLFTYQRVVMPTSLPIDENDHSITMTVVSETTLSGYANTFYARVKTVDNERCTEKVKVRISTDNNLGYMPGDILKGRFEIVPTQPASSPGAYDEKEREAVEGVKVIVEAARSDVDQIGQQHLFWFSDVAFRLKTAVSEKIKETMPYDYADVLCAMLFGSDVENDTVNDIFSACGISHLLCVSGLHVGYLYVFLWAILSFFFPKEKNTQKTYLICALLFLYCVFVGFSPGVMRSTLMLVCVLLSSVWAGKKADSFNALCFAGVVILLINPLMLFDLSFLLSFACMVGIIVLYPVAEEWIMAHMQDSFLRFLVLSLAYCVCVLLVSTPVSVNVFHSFTFFSLISTILILPVAWVIFVVGLLYAITIFILPIPLLTQILNILINYILVYAAAFFRMGGLIEGIRGLFVFEMIAYYAGLLFVFGYLDFKKKWIRGVLACVLCALIVSECVIYMPRNELRVAFLDVGHGDSILITTPSNKHYLIDGGGTASQENYTAEWTILPYLYHLGYTSLDACFATNTSNGSIGGIEAISSMGKTPIVYINPVDKTNYSDLYALKAQSVAVETLSRGDELILDEGVTLQVLYPAEDQAFETKNNSSLVMMLSYQDVNILLSSNISKEVWLEYAEEFSSQGVNVVKASYYGNYYAQIDEIYDIIDPDFVVVSCGNNVLGLPKQAFLDMLKQKDIPYYTTRDNGTVRLVVRDGDYTLYPYIRSGEN